MNNELGIRNKGFTLTEILVYIAVLAIIVLAVSSFFLWTVHSNAKVKAMREVLDNSRGAMEIMSYEIKEAKTISSTSTSTHLYLENTTTTEFYLCGVASTTLCEKKGAQDPIELTSDKVEVKNLTFTQVATTPTFPSIQINLKIDYKNPQNRPELKASVNTTSTVSLRVY